MLYCFFGGDPYKVLAQPWEHEASKVEQRGSEKGRKEGEEFERWVEKVA